MAAAKSKEILDMLKSIKQDTEYIKVKMSIEEVDAGELSEDEKLDLKEAFGDLKTGRAIKLHEL